MAQLWEPATDDEFPLHLLCSLEECGALLIVFPEGSNVVPNGKRRKYSVKLPLKQNSSGILFDFDSADWSVSKEHIPEDSPACSCKEMDGIQNQLTFFFALLCTDCCAESRAGCVRTLEDTQGFLWSCSCGLRPCGGCHILPGLARLQTPKHPCAKAFASQRSARSTRCCEVCTYARHKAHREGAAFVPESPNPDI